MKARVWCLALFAGMGVACRAPSPGNAEQAAATETRPGPSLFPGIGTHHHPIMTSNADAQKFFDQGVSLVFAFNHEEAVRSFQRASELDPGSPMPLWGLAWALGPNYNLDIDDPRARQALEAIDKAKSLSANAPQVEKDYVAAMAVRYAADLKADRAALARGYSQAMGELMRKYPDDLDAATLYAESLMNLHPWKLWTLDGKAGEDTPRILEVLESVLRRAPNHAGANHYYIHSVEASRAPERALPSAERLKTLAPSAGHLAHMPAHILARTGDHEGAAKANLAGAEADRTYLKSAPPDAYYGLAYYSHNLHFLSDSNMMRGRFADARQSAAELAERLTPHANMMPMIESMVVTPTSVLLRFGRYDDILKEPAPPADRPVMTAWRHFARGVALARKGQVDQATAEQTQLVASIARVPDSALFGGTGLESARNVLDIARLVLTARIAAARGTNDAATTFWRQAVAGADRVAYDEPPVWFYPIRESLGAALLQSGRPADAEQVFREDLTRHPRNARSLFGLRESLMQQNKTSDAAWVDSQFKEAWKDADSTLTVEDL